MGDPALRSSIASDREPKFRIRQLALLSILLANLSGRVRDRHSTSISIDELTTEDYKKRCCRGKTSCGSESDVPKATLAFTFGPLILDATLLSARTSDYDHSPTI